MLFNTWSFIGVFVISFLNVALNAKGFCHVLTKFDIRQHCVFKLIFMDSASSLICAVSNSFLVSTLQSGLFSGTFPCVGIFIGNYFPIVLGPICTSLISIIRIVYIRRASKNICEDHSIKTRLKIFLGLCVLSFILYHGLHLYWDLPLSNISEYCIRGNQARPQKLGSRLANLFTLLPPLVSLVSDYKLVRLFRRISDSADLSSHTKGSKYEPLGNPSTNCVPVKATVLSALIFITYLSMAILINMVEFDAKTKAAGFFGSGLVVNALRSPLTILIVFKVNLEQKKSKDRERARTKKLDREMFLANKRRIAMGKLERY